jgi:hypothetical protein
VAAAAASGAADVGPGILAAARALDLDFIPLLKERYDLVIPREHYTSDRLAPLLEIVRGADFRRDVEALGGYDASIVMDAVMTVPPPTSSFTCPVVLPRTTCTTRPLRTLRALSFMKSGPPRVRSGAPPRP